MNEAISNTDIATYTDKVVDLALGYAPKLVGAILVVVIGFWLIRLFLRFFIGMMEKRDVDPSLRTFLKSFLRVGLKILVLITAISMLGVEMTSFVALLGAAGLAVGLALQGSLANFAGGVLILVFKPFKVGDLIEAQGFTGRVKSIKIFHTTLTTADNETVILPNGNLSNDAIKNFDTVGSRRIDMVFGIGYEDDIKVAKKILSSLATSDKRVLKDPAPEVFVKELADSSVNLGVRAWADPEDYWGVYFDMQERVKEEFDKNKISIPYPQTDIHIQK